MIITQDLTYFILILARMSGFILFNQIFGRKGVPAIFQIGLSIILSISVYGILPPTEKIEIDLIIVFSFRILMELFIGFVIGYILRLFFSVVNISGDIIDFQVGFSMAKVYDPSQQIQMGVSASFFNLFMMLLFFSVGGHLTLVQIIITSYKIIPLGGVVFNAELARNICVLFSYVMVYAIKFSLPIIAIEFISEMGVGIMMKAIPQIHLFVVNIPLKMGIGLVSMIILAPSFANFLEKIILLMFEAIENNLVLLM